MSTTGWVVGGLAVATTIGVVLWYQSVQAENARIAALSASGLSGLGTGVDQTRSDVTNVLGAIGEVFKFGTQVAKTVGEENARAAQANAQTSRSTPPSSTETSRSTGSGKGLSL